MRFLHFYFLKNTAHTQTVTFSFDKGQYINIKKILITLGLCTIQYLDTKDTHSDGHIHMHIHLSLKTHAHPTPMITSEKQCIGGERKRVVAA